MFSTLAIKETEGMKGKEKGEGKWGWGISRRHHHAHVYERRNHMQWMREDGMEWDGCV